MSVLFGGGSNLCDYCGAGIDTGAKTTTITLHNEETALKLSRHFCCAACADVAADRFRMAFARIPLVRELSEAEHGDVDYQAPDRREFRRASPFLHRACPVCGEWLEEIAFMALGGKLACSPKCADKIEANERAREEFLERRRKGLPESPEQT